MNSEKLVCKLSIVYRDYDIKGFIIFFSILIYNFFNIIIGIRDILSNTAYHALWLAQRDVTELHAEDNVQFS